MADIRLSVQLHLELTTVDDVVAAARRFEAAGTYAVFVWDHFFPHYRRESGAHLEGWTTLVALACATDRVKLGPLVSCVPWRNPSLLADMSRTTDVISGGRLILGLGAGWNRDEFRAYGYKFHDLDRRLQDLRSGIVTVRKRLPILDPPPVGAIPIVVGGGSRKLLRIAASLADEWNWFGWNHENPIPKFCELRAAFLDDCRRVDRPADDVPVSIVLQPSQVAYADAAAEAGATHIIVTLPHPYDEGAFSQIQSRLGI